VLKMERVFLRSGAALLLSVLVNDVTLAVVWLAHDPAHPAPGEEVTVRLMEGEPFDGAERGHRFERSARLQHLWKGGRSNLGAGDRSGEVRIRPDAAGVQLLAYSSAPTERLGALTSHHAKALVVVGDAAPANPLRWSELGQRLEIVPQSDPVQLLRSGGQLEVQVLWEREPLVGVSVEALLRGGPRSGLKAVTDEIGVARFDLTMPGSWIIRVEHDTRSDEGAVLALATLTLIAHGVR